MNTTIKFDELSKEYYQSIAGESFYQPALKKYFDLVSKSVVTVVLSPEPDNQFDKNAIKATVNGETVGYLPKKDAKEFHQALERRSLPMVNIETKGIIRRSIVNGEPMYAITLDAGNAGIINFLDHYNFDDTESTTEDIAESDEAQPDVSGTIRDRSTQLMLLALVIIILFVILWSYVFPK